MKQIIIILAVLMIAWVYTPEEPIGADIDKAVEIELMYKGKWCTINIYEDRVEINEDGTRSTVFRKKRSVALEAFARTEDAAFTGEWSIAGEPLAHGVMAANTDSHAGSDNLPVAKQDRKSFWVLWFKAAIGLILAAAVIIAIAELLVRLIKKIKKED